MKREVPIQTLLPMPSIPASRSDPGKVQVLRSYPECLGLKVKWKQMVVGTSTSTDRAQAMRTSGISRNPLPNAA